MRFVRLGVLMAICLALIYLSSVKPATVSVSILDIQIFFLYVTCALEFICRANIHSESIMISVLPLPQPAQARLVPHLAVLASRTSLRVADTQHFAETSMRSNVVQKVLAQKTQCFAWKQTGKPNATTVETTTCFMVQCDHGPSPALSPVDICLPASVCNHPWAQHSLWENAQSWVDLVGASSAPGCCRFNVLDIWITPRMRHGNPQSSHGLWNG